MHQLFRIEDNGDIKLQDDTILLIPELKEVYSKFGSNHIRYIVLYCDYKSPYRRLPPTAKELEVCSDIFGLHPKKVKNLKDKLIISAIKKYKKLQFDPMIELFNVYTEKIGEYNIYLRAKKVSDDNHENQAKTISHLEKITDARENLRLKILEKEEESKLMGGGDISLLENLIQ